jgi:hypothetical protein
MQECDGRSRKLLESPTEQGLALGVVAARDRISGSIG